MPKSGKPISAMLLSREHPNGWLPAICLVVLILGVGFMLFTDRIPGVMPGAPLVFTIAVAVCLIMFARSAVRDRARRRQQAADREVSQRACRQGDALIATKRRAPIGSLLVFGEWLPAHRGPGESRRLKPLSSRLVRVIDPLPLTILWNGIVALFVVRGIFWGILTSSIIAAFVMIWVALLGLCMLASVIRDTLVLANPRVRLTTTSDTIPLGGVLDLAWDTVGGLRRIHRLHISLVGEERSKIFQHPNKRTVKHTFATLTLIDTDDPAQISSGAASIMIPADAMHSFTATYNKIVWQLHVHGHIRRWPDVEDTFPIVVVPAQTNG